MAVNAGSIGGARWRFELFKDVSGEWRWHLKAPNGRIVASSAGDGYKRLDDALQGISLVQREGPEAEIRHVNEEV